MESSRKSVNWPEEERGTKPWFEKLRERYPEGGQHPSQIGLKAWSRAAIAYQKIYNKTNKETAEHFDVKLGRYERHKRSHAGKDWQDKIEEIMEDPNEVTRLVLQSEGLGLALDQFVLYETAKAKGDVATAHKIGKTLLDYADLAPKKVKEDQRMAPQIVINLAGSDMLESPVLEAEWSIVSNSTATALLSK